MSIKSAARTNWCSTARPLRSMPTVRSRFNCRHFGKHCSPRTGCAGAGGRWGEGPVAGPDDLDEADYAACMLGLRDYVDKNRFKGVVIGLSGGIDSALCATMATDALGRERVRCLMLPFRYTSQESLD